MTTRDVPSSSCSNCLRLEAEQARLTKELQQEQNERVRFEAMLSAIAGVCDGVSPDDFMLSWTVVRGVDDLARKLEAAKAALSRYQSPLDFAAVADGLGKYVEWCGGVHDDGCPEDDTCDCSGAVINQAVNEAVEHFRFRARAALTPLGDPEKKEPV